MGWLAGYKQGMKAIPEPIRERIIQMYERGKSTADIAAFCGCCVAAVRRVRQQFRQRGSLQPQTHLCGRTTLLTAQRKEQLQKLVERQPDATLAELGGQLDRVFGTSTVDVWLRRMGLSCKKTLHAAEPSRSDVAEQRKHWHQRLSDVPAERLVFVDESGVHTKMTRLYGRSTVGQRLVCPVPHGHYQTTTMIAAVRLIGPEAPWLFEGAMDGEMFLAWVRQGLVPTLHPGDVVILDNLAMHKVAGVRESLQAAGARLLYLPPCSPDFNPIENMWSKVKQNLRSLAPRDAEALLQAAKTAFAALTPADCRGFFLHARYAT
jgi:transposase